MEQIDTNVDMYFGKVDVNKILRGKLINFNLPLFCVLWLKIKVYKYLNLKLKRLKMENKALIFD